MVPATNLGNRLPRVSHGADIFSYFAWGLSCATLNIMSGEQSLPVEFVERSTGCLHHGSQIGSYFIFGVRSGSIALEPVSLFGQVPRLGVAISCRARNPYNPKTPTLPNTYHPAPQLPTLTIPRSLSTTGNPPAAARSATVPPPISPALIPHSPNVPPLTVGRVGIDYSVTVSTPWEMALWLRQV